MRTARLPVLVLLAVGAACAPKTAPLPVVTTPRHPEFVYPHVPPELASSPAVASHERAWTYLQAGNLRGAEREASEALTLAPGFYPAAATAGYASLADRDWREALEHFDRALDQSRTYLPALMGRGEALVSLEREDDAAATFEAALAVDPSLSETRRRVEVLRFRGLEKQIASARSAAAAGRSADAIMAYRSAIARSPESAFLYREVATLEQQRGATADAVAHWRQALALEPGDTTSMAGIGQALEAEGDTEGALAVYDEILTLEALPSIAARRDALRSRLELARLPVQYQTIPSALTVSRGDLAALVGVHLGVILQARGGEAVVLTDVRGHWAEPWIMAVTAAGVIEPYANHTFQPSSAITRGDLAQIVVQLLPRVASAQNVQTWQASRGRFTDISNSHLAYPAASMAVASGVMAVTERGEFQPTRSVTGAEALDVIERLSEMAGPRRTTPVRP